MENITYKTDTTIGILLITGVFGVLLPYTLLTINFEYPLILRQDAGTILVKFHQGGAALVWTWFAFAFLGLPLLIAISLIGQKLENKFSHIRWASTLGKIAIIAQIIGLLRWVFVVPLLASQYVSAQSVAVKIAVKITFLAFHQFGGVLLGEHVGQLLTIAWTVMITSALGRINLVRPWLVWLGYIASFIYLLAQAELFTTVIPGFPTWAPAGMIGSTLWLIWLILVGFAFIKASQARLK